MAVTTPFATIEEAVEDIREGRLVVVVDDPDRENEGDLVVAAQFATPEAINFMAMHGRGLICLCLTPERCDELALRPAATHNTSRYGTAFMDTIEAREGVTTGISAHDRARTVQVAIDPKSRPHEVVGALARIDCDLDGARAVVRGDAGRDPFAGLDRDRESGPERRLVALGHLLQAELIATLLG